MFTKLLNSVLTNQLTQLEFASAGTISDDYYHAWTYCSDGSCRGDCVGGCDGTPAGGF